MEGMYTEETFNRLAWQHFTAAVDFPKTGYYEGVG